MLTENNVVVMAERATFIVWGSVPRLIVSGLITGFMGVSLVVNDGPGFLVPIWFVAGVIFISNVLMLPVQMWTDGREVEARYLVRRKSLRVGELDEVRFGSTRAIRMLIKQPGSVLGFVQRDEVEFSVFATMRLPVRRFVSALKRANPSLRVSPSALLIDEHRDA